MQKLKVTEYAKLMQCDATTVYRWIKAEKVKTETIDGVLHVLADETDLQRCATATAEVNIILQLQVEVERQARELNKKDGLIDKLQQELAYTRREFDSARQRYDVSMQQMQADLIETRQRHDAIIQQIQQDAESAKQRSDTIILQLTRQFEEQTKLLEDMHHRSLWSKVKTAFGFAPS
jgi:hypothetical protein